MKAEDRKSSTALLIDAKKALTSFCVVAQHLIT
jgi:hypothetical protein